MVAGDKLRKDEKDVLLLIFFLLLLLLFIDGREGLFVETIKFGRSIAVNVVIPIAYEVLLTEDGPVGAEEGVLASPTCVATVVHLTSRLHVRVKPGVLHFLALEVGKWDLGVNWII